MEIHEKIKDLILRVKEEKPLVHHITNMVTMNDCANSVLALGGSPIMAYHKAEVEEIIKISSALVLNIGTPDPSRVESMVLAGKSANELGVPVVLDPVGVGATDFRKGIVEKIIREVKLSVIKGNMAEMKSIGGIHIRSKGVDSMENIAFEYQVAKKMAMELHCIIAVTGKEDLVTDGEELHVIHNGHEMLSRVTGTGCMTTSLIGTYCSVTKDRLLGTMAGIITMGIAGETAHKKLKQDEGLGMFKTRIMDSIYELSQNGGLEEGDIRIESINA